MNAAEAYQTDGVPLERAYWDVPVSLPGRAFARLSAKLDRQLKRLEARWVRRPLACPSRVTHLDSSTIA